MKPRSPLLHHAVRHLGDDLKRLRDSWQERNDAAPLWPYVLLAFLALLTIYGPLTLARLLS